MKLLGSTMAFGLVLFLVGCDSSGGGEPDAGCQESDRDIFEFGEADMTFYVGPYLEHTTRTSVAVGWETLEAGSTLLEYGVDDSYGQQVDGESGTMHQLVVNGLEPGSTYHYRACTDDTCTGDLVFSTAPEPGQPFRFAVYGDCQSNPEIHEQVVENIIADEANMIVVVGDTVSEGNIREQYKELFYDPARRFAHRAPRWAAPGNHDYKDQELVNYRDYHIFPEDEGVPLSEASFSFVYGDVFFLILDDTLDHFDMFFPLGGVETDLYVWISQQVASEAAQNAKWRFAFAHYPADSNCYAEDDGYTWPESAVREFLVPQLRENNFHAFFAGHMHCYERFDFDGLLVITTGGGGGGLDPTEQCVRGVVESKYSECVHHHMLVDIGCQEALIWARHMDGEVIEKYSLQADGSFQLLQ